MTILEKIPLRVAEVTVPSVGTWKWLMVRDRNCPTPGMLLRQ
jgi:hypothetical protein